MAIFIDTSFLLALSSPRDHLHARAVMWKYALSGPFVTTEFVLLEVADAFADPTVRKFAIQIIESIRNGPGTEVVSVSADWFERGHKLFRERLDKAWGLTDCISFQVMVERGMTDALTHDHHFEQAGFRALLRYDPPSN